MREKHACVLSVESWLRWCKPPRSDVLECTIFYKVFDEGNRADMKSGDTNIMIYILEKMHTYAQNIA